jgi:predicted nucleic acid-binding protein
VLLDTSGLLCFLERRDFRHNDAVTLFASAPTRLTHNYVLAELIALAQARDLPRVAILDFCRDLVDSPAVRFEWVTPEINAAALALLQARGDKSWSLCDAVSFVIMKRNNVREALTTDHHFVQAGFGQLLVSEAHR